MKDVAGVSAVERLAALGRVHGERTAIQEASGRRITYRQLATEVEHLAAGFSSIGLHAGDRIAFAIRPSIASIVTLIACLRAGIVPVLVDPVSGPELLASRMNLARPRAIASEAILFAASGTAPGRWILRRRGVTMASIADVAPLRLYAGSWLPGLPPHSLSLKSVARSGAAWGPFRSTAVAPEAMSAVVFTSGTTAAPKGVRHTPASLEATIELIGALAEFDESSVLASGDAHLIVPLLLAGGRVELPPRNASAEQLVEHAMRVRATHLATVPVDADGMAVAVAAGRAAFPASLRTFLIASAPTSRRTVERLAATLPPGARGWCIYGSTELLPIAAASIAEKLAHDGPGELAGRPLPGIQIHITEAGEVIADGPGRAPGYLGGPDLPAHATGDLGALLADGRLVLHGRTKDMLLRRGVNVYPGLYEPTIQRIPGIAAAAMVGDLDPETADERVVLFVVPTRPDLDPRALVASVRAHLASGPFQIDGSAQPDQILVVDAIPIAGRSRKPDRQALRREASRQRAAWVD